MRAFAFFAGTLPLLRLGSTDPKVFDVQGGVSARGFVVALTGVFDQATLDAVKAFQAASGLKPDGIVGPLTWKALGFVDQTTAPATPAATTPPAIVRVQPQLAIPWGVIGGVGLLGVGLAIALSRRS